MPDLARFNDLPRLYANRQRLRNQFAKVRKALDEVPRDQQKVNRLRAALPRPMGDRDFWELIHWEEKVA